MALGESIGDQRIRSTFGFHDETKINFTFRRKFQTLRSILWLKRARAQFRKINNRNLATFDVSLETTERIRPMISPEIAVVAEV